MRIYHTSSVLPHAPQNLKSHNWWNIFPEVHHSAETACPSGQQISEKDVTLLVSDSPLNTLHCCVLSAVSSFRVSRLQLCRYLLSTTNLIFSVIRCGWKLQLTKLSNYNFLHPSAASSLLPSHTIAVRGPLWHFGTCSFLVRGTAINLPKIWQRCQSYTEPGNGFAKIQLHLDSIPSSFLNSPRNQIGSLPRQNCVSVSCLRHSSDMYSSLYRLWYTSQKYKINNTAATDMTNERCHISYSLSGTVNISCDGVSCPAITHAVLYVLPQVAEIKKKRYITK